MSNSPRPWDPALQAERGAQLLGLVRGKARDFFAPDGRCVVSDQVDWDSSHRRLPPSPFYLRERVNTVLALMAGDESDIAFGNLILDQIPLSPSDDFSTMNLIEMLLRHPQAVSPENTQRLLDVIAHEATHLQYYYNFFVGGNDNFPAMGCFIMVVGGELVNDDRAVQAGLDSLYSARDLLSRRGFFSEYNSPTYAGVTLHGLDETANHARHAEARALACQASERMWLDVAAHWHPHLSFQAGPYSRAYHNNSIAWSALTNILMWTTFGDCVFISPQRSLFDQSAFCHEVRAGNLAFCQAGCGGYAGTIHHIPDYVGELVLAKTYPFRVRGTAEYGSFHLGEYRKLPSGALQHIPGRTADFGANSAQISTLLEEDFAVGVASRGLCGGGGGDLFHVLWRRRAPAGEWADLRTVFTRYLVNETRPEDPDSLGLLAQQGIGFGLHDDRRALVLYHPNGYLHEGIHSLRLSLVLQELSGPLDEVWIGDRRLDSNDGESAAPDWVIVRDGPMLLAFYPLPTTHLGREVAIRSRSENGYRVLSFYNYQGPSRDFTQHELQIVQNGFVFEAATTADYSDVPAFLAELRRAEISDTTVLEARCVRYLRDGRELFLWLDPAQQSVKAAAVNGKEAVYPPLEITGVDVSRLPWLAEPGPLHHSLDWWKRIAARGGIEGMEGLSGTLVE